MALRLDTPTIRLAALSLSRRTLGLLVGVAAIVLWGAALALPGNSGGAAAAREITIAAQDVRFNGSNPPLELKVGEKVALTVVNQDGGIVHDFVIAGLGVRTSRHLQPGESQTLEFTPTKAGRLKYSCTLHPGLMDGQIIVRGP